MPDSCASCRYDVDVALVANLSEKERLEHLYGFVTGTWSYSVILSTFLGKINDKQKIRVIFSDDYAGTDVFAGDINPDGKLNALPLNAPIDASEVFAEQSYPSKSGGREMHIVGEGCTSRYTSVYKS